MVKKVVVGILAVALMFAVPVAADVVKQVTWDTTRVTDVSFRADYDRNTGELLNLVLTGTSLIIDDGGNPVGTYTTQANWADLPGAQRTQVRPFLEWVTQQINNQAVSEDVSQDLSNLP